MDGIYLTEDELWALSRCRGWTVKAYLHMRMRMDIRTGVVGQRTRICTQSLIEWMTDTEEKGSGAQEIKPGKEQTRGALRQLERRGLIRKIVPKGYVFLCPLARLVQSRPERTQHKPHTEKQGHPNTEPNTNPTQLESNSGQGFDVFRWAESNTEPNTNPTQLNGTNSPHIGDGVDPSTQQAACTPVNGVHAPARGRAAVTSLAAMESAPMPDELSRRATELAVALRKEGLQGVNSANPRVRSWAEAGATPAQVVEALAVARSRRGATGSHQPIGAGYLDPIVRDILNPPKPRTADAWWVNVPAMDAKARELGIGTARAGESEQDYKARIRAALMQSEARKA